MTVAHIKQHIIGGGQNAGSELRPIFTAIPMGPALHVCLRLSFLPLNLKSSKSRQKVSFVWQGHVTAAGWSLSFVTWNAHWLVDRLVGWNHFSLLPPGIWGFFDQGARLPKLFSTMFATTGFPFQRAVCVGQDSMNSKTNRSLQKVNSISIWMAEGGLNEFCKCPMPWQRDAPHYKAFPLELGSKTSLVSGGRVFNWLFNCSSAECHPFIFILQLADCRLSRWPDEVPHETVPKLIQFS